MGDLEEDKAVTLVADKLAKGEPALSILEELQAGMNIAGQRFEDCEYLLSELIYAADIFKKAGALVDQATADYVGADIYCKTAQDGVIAAKNVLGVN